MVMEIDVVDDREAESMIDAQSTQTVVDVGVLRRQGVAETHPDIAVGRGSVEEVEIVPATDVEVEADLLRDMNPVAVRHQTGGSNRSRHLGEWTCQTKVVHPIWD